MNRLVQKGLALALFIFGIIFFIGQSGITGAAIGLPKASMPLSVFIALITIFSGLLLFIEGKSTGLEEKIDDANVNSFRRWLEKKEHHKIQFGKAANLYREYKDNYDKAVANGVIIQDYSERPLKWVEDYYTSLKEFEEWHHKRYKEPKDKKSDEELNQLFYALSKDYISNLKKGSISPNTKLDSFVKTSVTEIKSSSSERAAKIRAKDAKNDRIQLKYEILDTSLKRLAEEARNNSDAESDLDHLVLQFNNGNKHPGLGRPGHIKKTDVNYLRGRSGGRVFYFQIDKNNYAVIAEADKDNEEQVIRILQDKSQEIIDNIKKEQNNAKKAA